MMAVLLFNSEPENLAMIVSAAVRWPSSVIANLPSTRIRSWRSTRT